MKMKVFLYEYITIYCIITTLYVVGQCSSIHSSSNSSMRSKQGGIINNNINIRILF